MQVNKRKPTSTKEYAHNQSLYQCLWHALIFPAILSGSSMYLLSNFRRYNDFGGKLRTPPSCHSRPLVWFNLRIFYNCKSDAISDNTLCLSHKTYLSFPAIISCPRFCHFSIMHKQANGYEQIWLIFLHYISKKYCNKIPKNVIRRKLKAFISFHDKQF